VIVLGLGVAVAQQDPIAARKALMMTNGDQAKIGAAMMKGEGHVPSSVRLARASGNSRMHCQDGSQIFCRKRIALHVEQCGIDQI